MDVTFTEYQFEDASEVSRNWRMSAVEQAGDNEPAVRDEP
jgi:hypothetical protein